MRIPQKVLWPLPGVNEVLAVVVGVSTGGAHGQGGAPVAPELPPPPLPPPAVLAPAVAVPVWASTSAPAPAPSPELSPCEAADE